MAFVSLYTRRFIFMIFLTLWFLWSFKSNIALTRILKLCFFPHFVLYFFSFWTRFVTMCWFSKRWANLQTHAKPCSPQNIPNAVPERPSRLIVSVTFDDFYRINQTFWCSTVGVFLIETHKNTTFLKLFSKQYCIDSTFIFHEIVLIFSRLLKATSKKI